mmetsp:Transcript_17258/g.22425  ORF Transcript_17258/g.22425 Transcript_17258/m.22425 type:complete len:245 (+) Transcript_17258:109-843(+)
MVKKKAKRQSTSQPASLSTSKVSAVSKQQGSRMCIQFPALKSQYYDESVLELQELYPGAVYVAQNFFSQKECSSFVDAADAIGFESVSHPATKIIAHRKCGRIQREDIPLSKSIFSRITAVLDLIVGHHGSDLIANRNLVGCNPNIRVYKYDKGDSFGRHVDSSDNVPLLKGRTEVTVLVYLTSCFGGSTRFFPPHGKRRGGFAFEPQAGAILLHIHGDRCLEHEADPVLGGLKYVLRTDIVYS